MAAEWIRHPAIVELDCLAIIGALKHDCVSSLNDTEDVGTMEEREQPTGGRSKRPNRKVYGPEWVNV
jgi:hypothetical protein